MSSIVTTEIMGGRQSEILIIPPSWNICSDWTVTFKMGNAELHGLAAIFINHGGQWWRNVDWIVLITNPFKLCDKFRKTSLFWVEATLGQNLTSIH